MLCGSGPISQGAVLVLLVLALGCEQEPPEDAVDHLALTETVARMNASLENTKYLCDERHPTHTAQRELCFREQGNAGQSWVQERDRSIQAIGVDAVRACLDKGTQENLVDFIVVNRCVEKRLLEAASR